MKNLHTNEMMTADQISKPFDLTLGQLKQLAQADHNIRDTVDALNDQPDWLLSMGGVSDVCEINAIYQGGCASGAFMPAVTYNTALQVMSEHGDDILEYVEDVLGEIPAPKTGESWSGMAVYYVSMAVELWSGSLVDEYSLYDLDY